MKHLRLFLLVPFVLLAFSACQQPPQPPSASMTASGPGGGANSTGDYVSTYGSTFGTNELGPGLETRPGIFENGIREEGLLPSVYFDFDSSFVRAADRPLLQEAADYLLSNPNTVLLIEGYCDWRGTTEYNLTLGDRRASSVKEFIVALGIAPERIDTVSFGDRNATPEAAEAQMQQDRRADLVVIH